MCLICIIIVFYWYYECCKWENEMKKKKRIGNKKMKRSCWRWREDESTSGGGMASQIGLGVWWWYGVSNRPPIQVVVWRLRSASAPGGGNKKMETYWREYNTYLDTLRRDTGLTAGEIGTCMQAREEWKSIIARGTHSTWWWYKDEEEVVCVLVFLHKY